MAVVENLVIIQHILIQKNKIINMTCVIGIDLLKVLNMYMLITRKASSRNCFNAIVKKETYPENALVLDEALLVLLPLLMLTFSPPPVSLPPPPPAPPPIDMLK